MSVDADAAGGASRAQLSCADEGNARLVYSLVRYANSFKQLNALTLSDAVVPSDGRAPDAFVPTAEWLAGWKTKLPIGTVLRLLEHLEPAVNKLVLGDADDDERIFEYLRQTTMVGVLPVPHAILIRKVSVCAFAVLKLSSQYQHNNATSNWFRNFLWGVIFTRNTQPPIFCKS